MRRTRRCRCGLDAARRRCRRCRGDGGCGVSGMGAKRERLFTVTPSPSEFETETVQLSLDSPFWERVFTVSPLVLVGTKETDGTYDLAPKNLAMPLGWGNRFCFVCTPTPRHVRECPARAGVHGQLPAPLPGRAGRPGGDAPGAGRLQAQPRGPADLPCSSRRRRPRPRLLPLPRVQARAHRRRLRRRRPRGSGASSPRRHAKTRSERPIETTPSSSGMSRRSPT